MNNIKIQNKTIGDGKPCFIIAEAGVNHNGDLNTAKKLIRIATEAGADAVKFQTWITEEVVTKAAEKASYQIKNTGNPESQYEMLKKLELSFDDFIDLKKYSENKGIMFLSSADDEKSLDFLDDIGVPAFKVASGILNNSIMLKHLARKQKPIILSTGMSTMDEIETAIDTIKSEGNEEIVLLQCTSNYPVDYEDINLNVMKSFREKFSLPVGFSDHSLGIEIPIAATALGACIIEKHFTYNKKSPGVDHAASINPSELRNMVKGIRNVELALGSFKKKPAKCEEEMRLLARESLVAASDIRKGTCLTEDFIATKRPGTGIQPNQIHLLLGRTVKRDIRKDELFNTDMLR